MKKRILSDEEFEYWKSIFVALAAKDDLIDIDFDDVWEEDQCDNCANCSKGCHTGEDDWVVRECDSDCDCEIPCEDCVCERKEKKCECGADKCKSPIHSNWCPKYSK